MTVKPEVTPQEVEEYGRFVKEQAAFVRLMMSRHRSLLEVLLALLADIEDSHDYDELRRRVKKTNEVIALERIPVLPEEPGA